MTDGTENDRPRPEEDEEDFVTGSHYAKLYASILDSSVWGEEPATRLVWITLLVMCDRDGFVESSDPGIYRRANVTKADGQAALKVLSSPDLESKSKEWGGRRIERVQGGWKILNYEKYRDAQTPKQKQTAERVARWRRKKEAEAEWSKRHEGQALPADFAENWERYVTQGYPSTVSVAVASSSSSSSGSVGDVENPVEGVDKSPPSPAPTPGPADKVRAALETELDREAFGMILDASPNPYAYAAECWARLEGMHPPKLTPRQLGEALRDYFGNGHHVQPSFKHFRSYLARPDRPKNPPEEGGGATAPLVPAGSGPTGEAGAILARLRSGGMKAAAAEPPEVRQALEAAGGLAVVTDCRADRWGFLVRDFVAHLAHARANPRSELESPPPAPAPAEPPPPQDRPAMAEANAEIERWKLEHPGEPVPPNLLGDWRSTLTPPPPKGKSKGTGKA